jgi:hypothetical protein
MDTLSRAEAQGMLAEWGAMIRRRDDLIRAGLRTGLSISEVSRLTGCSRATIYRAIAPASGPASLPGVPPALFLPPAEIA